MQKFLIYLLGLLLLTGALIFVGCEGEEGKIGDPGDPGDSGSVGFDNSTLAPADRYFAVGITNGTELAVSGNKKVYLSFDSSVAASSDTVVANHVTLSPLIDGVDGEEAEWGVNFSRVNMQFLNPFYNGQPLQDPNISQVTVRAAYDEAYVYMQFQWKEIIITAKDENGQEITLVESIESNEFQELFIDVGNPDTVHLEPDGSVIDTVFENYRVAVDTLLSIDTTVVIVPFSIDTTVVCLDFNNDGICDDIDGDGIPDTLDVIYDTTCLDLDGDDICDDKDNDGNPDTLGLVIDSIIVLDTTNVSLIWKTTGRNEDRLVVFWEDDKHLNWADQAFNALFPSSDIAPSFSSDLFIDAWVWGASKSNPVLIADDWMINNAGGRPDVGDPPYISNLSLPDSQAIYMNRLDPNLRTSTTIGNSIYPLWEYDAVGFVAGINTIQPGTWVANRKAFLPGIVTTIPSGSRSDVLAIAVFDNGVWTLEMRRARQTNNGDDLVF